MKPTMTEVQSSMIYSLGYDEDRREMYVRFRSKGNPGALWMYAGVPADRFESVKNSSSVGSAFLSDIRSRYSATRLSS